MRNAFGGHHITAFKGIKGAKGAKGANKRGGILEIWVVKENKSLASRALHSKNALHDLRR